MKLSISETARISGVSVRTLHYYDSIGILRPAQVGDNGYRCYSEAELERLRQIMFYRELEFPLKEIALLLDDPPYGREEALSRQRELLVLKRRRLDGLIRLLEDNLRGESEMSFKEFKNNDYEDARASYAAEARERWGSTPQYAESEKRAAGRGEDAADAMEQRQNEIFAAFAAAAHSDPASPEANALVERWRAHISENWYECTPEILASLGGMYVGDERFKATLDAFGEGTAEFMSRAIEEYCKIK